MNKYIIHLIITFLTYVVYFFLNDINNTNMCHFLVRFVCCNKNMSEKDSVYDPTSVDIPLEDVKKVGEAIENVVDDVIEQPTKGGFLNSSGVEPPPVKVKVSKPRSKTVKELTKTFEDKKD